jgi:xanthine dehydrogenase accessory factor
MDRKLTREALRLMEAHQPFVRASVVASTGSVPGKIGATMIVRADGSTVGTVGGAALEQEVKALAAERWRTRESDLRHFELKSWVAGGVPSLCGGSVDIAIEYVPARPNILIWGGGHVAHALARLLPTLEYDYSVADDRPDWIGPDRFPDAERREAVAPARLFDVMPPESFTHLYILGYDALRDLEVLDQALARFPNEIGLIASRAKRAHLFAKLRARGADADRLARVRSPVGLPIGAETPEEIAVSIVAEIVRGMHPDHTDKKGPVSLSLPPEEHGRSERP